MCVCEGVCDDLMRVCIRMRVCVCAVCCVCGCVGSVCICVCVCVIHVCVVDKYLRAVFCKVCVQCV